MPNADEIKGRAEEAAGAVTGDKGLKNEGRADQVAGKAERAGETIREKVSKAADKLKAKAHRE